MLLKCSNNAQCFCLTKMLEKMLALCTKAYQIGILVFVPASIFWRGSITSRCSGKEPALLPWEECRSDSRERRKSRLHRHASKKKFENHSVKKLNKLSCHRKLIIKTLLQVSGLYVFPILHKFTDRHVSVPPRNTNMAAVN